MDIQFTQYLMPHGQTTTVKIDRPDEIAEKARRIAFDLGLKFEIEMLTDYSTISMTIADKEEEVDLGIKLCPNGPKVPEKIDEMVNEFYAMAEACEWDLERIRRRVMEEDDTP